MSWLWRSSPSTSESSSDPQSHQDPYAFTNFSDEPLHNDHAADNPFGTAFTDDSDLQQSAADSAFAPYPQLSQFDLYSPSQPHLDFSSAANIDPAILNPRAALARPSVDYVFDDHYDFIRKKGVGEQLTYLAGSSYLTGAAVGAATAMVSALRESAGKPTRLRLNAVLNATGKRGAMLANTAGILGLTFSLSESAIYSFTNSDDLPNYAAAGAIAGGLFKSTRGPRTAAFSALAGAAVAVGAVYASRTGFYGTRIQGVL